MSDGVTECALIKGLAKRIVDKMINKPAGCGCENEECSCKKVVEKPVNLPKQTNKYIDMAERANIVKFLKNLNEKNYAEAHKYLKKIMESKLQKRISNFKGIKLF